MNAYGLIASEHESTRKIVQKEFEPHHNEDRDRRQGVAAFRMARAPFVALSNASTDSPWEPVRPDSLVVPELVADGATQLRQPLRARSGRRQFTSSSL